MKALKFSTKEMINEAAKSNVTLTEEQMKFFGRFIEAHGPKFIDDREKVENKKILMNKEQVAEELLAGTSTTSGTTLENQKYFQMMKISSKIFN